MNSLNVSLPVWFCLFTTILIQLSFSSQLDVSRTAVPSTHSYQNLITPDFNLCARTSHPHLWYRLPATQTAFNNRWEFAWCCVSVQREGIPIMWQTLQLITFLQAGQQSRKQNLTFEQQKTYSCNQRADLPHMALYRFYSPHILPEQHCVFWGFFLSTIVV